MRNGSGEAGSSAFLDWLRQEMRERKERERDQRIGMREDQRRKRGRLLGVDERKREIVANDLRNGIGNFFFFFFSSSSAEASIEERDGDCEESEFTVPLRPTVFSMNLMTDDDDVSSASSFTGLSFASDLEG